MTFVLRIFLVISLAFQSTPRVHAQPDAEMQRVVLKLGEEAEVNGGRIHVRFDAMLSDSRCPRGKRCVWAGEAKVQLRVRQGSSSDTSHVVAGPRRSFYPIGSKYFVQMRSLEPYPGDRTDRPGEYTLTLIFRRGSTEQGE